MLPYTAAPVVESVLGTVYDRSEAARRRPTAAFLDGWGPTPSAESRSGVVTALRAVLGRARPA